MKSLILILFLRLLALLPLGLARSLGTGLGKLNWLVGSRMSQTTLTNLEICYPNLSKSERTLLAKSSIINTFQTIVESGAAWLWPQQKVLERVLTVEGLALLQDAVARKKGVIVIAPHLGNWEVLGLYLDSCGCGQTHYLYQAPRDKKLEQLVYHARSRGGAKLVATNKQGVVSLVHALQKGEVTGILPDQVPPESGGKFAPFFGKQVLTMTLVSRLASKTGAKVVLGVAIRTYQDGKHGWSIKFNAVDPEVYAEHIHVSLAAMNKTVERVVEEYPEQYQWEYKRFKRVPAGEHRPY